MDREESHYYLGGESEKMPMNMSRTIYRGKNMPEPWRKYSNKQYQKIREQQE
jgi:hypothetical protein